ncbi:hypothetical protein [Streptomyces sp. NPDC048442]|uniref:hypothetical protein n=1 Tax=Streptomyces sp. NPDC048442 TaxID=3154823 RepID=UPI003440226B
MGLLLLCLVGLTCCTTSNKCTNSICGSDNDQGHVAVDARSPAARVNTSYLADLIRKGPFLEPLPRPLLVKGIKDVQIADGSSRIDAVALELEWPSNPETFETGINASAHLETYREVVDAKKRSERRFNMLRDQYKEFGAIHGTPEGFFLSGNHETIAGGTRGYVYVEAYSLPDANAFIPVATGTVNAMLKYADKMTALATGPQ